jgi:hypothetical protein
MREADLDFFINRLKRLEAASDALKGMAQLGQARREAEKSIKTTTDAPTPSSPGFDAGAYCSPATCVRPWGRRG